MRPLFLLVLAATLSAPAVTGRPVDAAQTPQKRLRAFGSEAELQKFFQTLAEEQKKLRRARVGGASAFEMAGQALPAAAPASADAKSESITNVQTAGVDEGGIVKLRGDHLVVLRRGRLFTIALGRGDLTPVSAADAFGPDIDPRGTWYDELLVSDDKVVVVGYSYARGGTELGIFDLDAAGQLHHRSTYHLRSNDYYSSRNYSSRLIGNKLVFYTPLYFRPDADPLSSLPAMRKWHAGAAAGEFRRIASANRIYQPAQPLNPAGSFALHSVTSCDLARPELECDATVVLGPAGRVFYVSQRAVYVWTTDWSRRNIETRASSVLFSMPLDGSAPGALQVDGSPVDQFSFLESDDNHLNVLVRANGNGDGMWAAERTRGGVALLRVPLGEIADGSTSAAVSRYRPLATPQGYTFQNRFVGNYLLYGTGSGWGRPQQVTDGARVFAVRWRGGDAFNLTLPHGVDRIEAIGSDAAVIGTDGRDLHFTTVRLGDRPSIADRYSRPDASQGELRSHGFFYKPDTGTSGLLGLPIRRAAKPGYHHLFKDSAGIVFLRNDGLHLQPVGELDSQPDRAADDRCRASCVDWYGNARPLFISGRVLALLGYEIVEGAIDRGRMVEKRRINYAPGADRR